MELSKQFMFVLMVLTIGLLTACDSIAIGTKCTGYAKGGRNEY